MWQCCFELFDSLMCYMMCACLCWKKCYIYMQIYCLTLVHLTITLVVLWLTQYYIIMRSQFLDIIVMMTSGKDLKFTVIGTHLDCFSFARSWECAYNRIILVQTSSREIISSAWHPFCDLTHSSTCSYNCVPLIKTRHKDRVTRCYTLCIW